MPSTYSLLDFEKKDDSTHYKGMDDNKVYFFTNRYNLSQEESRPDFSDASEKDDEAQRFHTKGGHFFRVGEAFVNKKEIKDGKVEYAMFDKETRIYKEIPEGTKKYGSHEAFGRVKNAMEEGRDVLVFVHGFKTNFSDSIEQVARLADICRIKRRVNIRKRWHRPLAFVFAWPSNGRALPFYDYFSDRADAKHSGAAMARAMMRFHEFMVEVRESNSSCKQKIHLLAHSMGNWAVENMLQGLIEQLGEEGLRLMFDNVFLVGADVDADALHASHNGKKLSLLSKIARRIHVYHNCNDLALDVSDATKFHPERLGSNGVDSFSGINRKITTIDCQKVVSGDDEYQHSYHLLSNRVVRDISAVLSGQLPDEISHRIPIEHGRSYRLLNASRGAWNASRGAWFRYNLWRHEIASSDFE